MNLDEAIAVFDKSAERTRPNKQTEAWTVIRAAIALMRGQSWQPIDTAPKDEGLKILGASNAEWTQDYYPVLVYEGQRFGSNKKYFGWYAPFDHDDRAPDPTHWMPLPAPPAPNQERDDA